MRTNSIDDVYKEIISMDKQISDFIVDLITLRQRNCELQKKMENVMLSTSKLSIELTAIQSSSMEREAQLNYELKQAKIKIKRLEDIIDQHRTMPTVKVEALDELSEGQTKPYRVIEILSKNESSVLKRKISNLGYDAELSSDESNLESVINPVPSSTNKLRKMTTNENVKLENISGILPSYEEFASNLLEAFTPKSSTISNRSKAEPSTHHADSMNDSINQGNNNNNNDETPTRSPYFVTKK